LIQAVAGREEVDDNLGLIFLYVWLGELFETRREWAKAREYHTSAVELRWIGRCYFESGALIGLARVKHAQGAYTAIPALLAEAEELAYMYEYYGHLAASHLTRGHLAWEGHTSEWGTGFTAALRFYQRALIYALCYNRFLLDEVLWSGGVCTPLRPITPYCLAQGAEGRRMLRALQDW
jgi:hypothetical protein